MGVVDGKVNIVIEGYTFPFNDALLREYADKMGDNLYDPLVLECDILAYAETVKEAVEKYGIDGVVKLAEDRIRLQLKIFD